MDKKSKKNKNKILTPKPNIKYNKHLINNNLKLDKNKYKKAKFNNIMELKTQLK